MGSHSGAGAGFIARDEASGGQVGRKSEYFASVRVSGAVPGAGGITGSRAGLVAGSEGLNTNGWSAS
jgi:hypothetical protein